MLTGELSSQRQSWVVRAGQHQELEPHLCNSVVHAGRTRHYAAPDRDSYYGAFLCTSFQVCRRIGALLHKSSVRLRGTQTRLEG